MPDYSQGKIYRLLSPHTDKYYIGSTCTRLDQRKWGHRGKYNLYLKGGMFRSAFKLFDLGPDDVQIELLELFPCDSKLELERREGELIKLNNNNVVNHFVAGRTLDEYKIDCSDRIKESARKYYLKIRTQQNIKNLERYHANKEKIKKEKKQWRDANKDEINKKSREYYAIRNAKKAQSKEVSVALE